MGLIALSSFFEEAILFLEFASVGKLKEVKTLIGEFSWKELLTDRLTWGEDYSIFYIGLEVTIKLVPAYF